MADIQIKQLKKVVKNFNIITLMMISLTLNAGTKKSRLTQNYSMNLL